MQLSKGKETFLSRYIGERVKNCQGNIPLQINVKVKQNNSKKLNLQTSSGKMDFIKMISQERKEIRLSTE